MLPGPWMAFPAWFFCSFSPLPLHYPAEIKQPPFSHPAGAHCKCPIPSTAGAATGIVQVSWKGGKASKNQTTCIL